MRQQSIEGDYAYILSPPMGEAFAAQSCLAGVLAAFPDDRNEHNHAQCKNQDHLASGVEELYMLTPQSDEGYRLLHNQDRHHDCPQYLGSLRNLHGVRLSLCD
jgi:hypothetical protein